MTLIIVSLILICAVLLVLVVLAQDSKGGGLANPSGATQLMGVQKTGDLLEKITWGFGVAVMVLSVTAAFFNDAQVDETGIPTSVGIESASKKAMPAAPQAPQQQEALPVTDSAAAQ